MGDRRRSAFSLVEMLVVVAVIALLIGIAVGVGRSQIAKANSSETAAMLGTLEMAARQFADEMPLAKVRGYRARYGDYPADELDGFVEDVGVHDPERTLGERSELSPKHLNIEIDGLKDVNNGDIKAFALTVRLYSESAAAILDRVPSKYRRAADDELPVGSPDGLPDEFLDRDDDGVFKTGDEPLDYFVDAWGTPLAYFATRRPDDLADAPDWHSQWDRDPNVNPHGNRWRTCAGLHSLSNDVPVFVSYGPDGPEQFAEDFQEDGYPPDLIYDFGEQAPRPEFTIDHPLNRDNVYSNETVQGQIFGKEMVEGVPI